MLQDLRFSLRSLVQARGFAAAAVLTLGVGIGATTAVYSIVDGLLLRPLPFGDRSDRLVTIHSVHPTQTDQGQIDDAGVSYPDVMDFRERAAGFEAIEIVGTRSVSLASDAESERVAAASVTPGLFRMLGATPARGRDFQEADGAAFGMEQVAIISDGMWKRLYGSDPDVIGRQVLMNGRTLSVVGVMPPRFDFPEGQQIWLPLRQERDAGRGRRGSFTAIGLTRDGVGVAQARDDLNRVADALAAAHPETNRLWSVHVAPMRDSFISSGTKLGVTSMFVAVALVLLAGCANIAGLLVARGLGRRRELAVRTALGASRGDLVRLLLCESAILAAAGLGLGLLVAAWTVRGLMSSMAEPLPLWAAPAMDSRALIFAALVSVAAAAAAGLLPAWRLSRVSSLAVIGSGTRSAGPSRDQRRLQSLLVAGQVALSFVLIAGAVLLSRSVAQLQHADAGFDAAPLASFRFYIAGDRYDDAAARAQTVARLAERLAALPGARAAAITGSVPADDGGATVTIVPAGGDRSREAGATIIPVSPGFWDVMGLSIEGRTFTAAEAVDPLARPAVIGRRLASRLWPGESPLGREVHLESAISPGAYRVVGVSPDVVYEEMGEASEQSQLVVYVPYAPLGYRTIAGLVRMDGDPAAALPAARAVVRSVDPAFAVFDAMTMTGRRASTMWSERLMGRTFSAFAVIGLLLACLGAYGLTAYAAAQRAREIGVRVAIGATRVDILRLLLGRGMRLAVAGALAGLPFALAAAGAMRGMLYGVSPWDPALWLLLPLLLVGAVLAASYVPAHRASGADPAMSLRRD